MKPDRPSAEEYSKHYGVSVEEAQWYLEKLAEFDKEEQRCLSDIFAGVDGPAIELGAGAGDFTQELLERYLKPGQRLYAVERLETAAAKLREAIADPRLEVLNSDSISLPLPEGAAGLVVSRAALHDFVSSDGDVIGALRDCVRVLAPGGVFLIYDKVTDGFFDVKRESAEGRMEQMNVELAALEGKKCWGLHRSGDYRLLLESLGLEIAGMKVLDTPDFPAYVAMMRKAIDGRRKAYVKRWGEGVNNILDRLYQDFESLPPRALSMVIIWATKHGN